ncbi:RagB/SusD family nutrient uptake outer membrane protein [Siphonobacter curvatus]|uniref:RagB/SusD family nutrient uptake outer membrane protein n=1 Tax=Siphonobacter curvatus TaxID=2094562 RepID=A0A2S7IL52_9BACT|nr:RagB/SusD family nutrient uptake outer membrane protein [Siphonobacter curvatus]PQA58358.1 RagB/SusD family nutrient uptake outer membrane protein [Siphonobacter curvatus]
MKRRYLLVTAFLTALVTSCTDDLYQTPISAGTTETFYTQQADFIQGVNAVYSDLRTYPDRLLNLSETRSDNLYAVSDGGVRDWEGINSFHKTIASNPYVTDAWNVNFNGIYRANVVLDQLVQKGSIITDATLRTRLEAEAKFLRAFMYFDLVRLFGKVPVIDHPVTAAEAKTIQRSSVTDVYNLILSDLQFAVANLPETYATAERGRATKFAAKAILALVYMTRSAPNYSIEGPGLGLNEWNLALAQLNDIIASGKYALVAKYSDIFSYTNENNPEVIFDIQYVTGLTPVVGGTFPWLLAPDTWFQSNGKPTQGGLTIRPVANDLLNQYPAKDVRKAFNIQTGYTYNGVTENRSFFKKYIDLTKVPVNRVDWPINFIVSRYTDILMLKAECILKGATGSQADVDAIVNQVRTRAGLEATSNVTLAQLYDERRLEFAAEGTRWHDLVRSGQITTLIPAWIAKEDVQKQMQTFVKEYIIYPLPQAELDAQPGLYTQNAGY